MDSDIASPMAQVGGGCRSWDVNEIIFGNTAKEVMFYEIYFIKHY